MMPCAPRPRIWRNCQALWRTFSSSVPFTGASTITVGVRWPERVGPPSTRPRVYSASPAMAGAGVTDGQVEGSASGATEAAAIDTEADPAAEGHLASNSDHFFTYLTGPLLHRFPFDDGAVGTRSNHAAVVGSFFYDSAS